MVQEECKRRGRDTGSGECAVWLLAGSGAESWAGLGWKGRERTGWSH